MVPDWLFFVVIGGLLGVIVALIVTIPKEKDNEFDDFD